jgi:hypothetical protein
MGEVENQRTVSHLSHRPWKSLPDFHTPATRQLLSHVKSKQTGRGVPELIAYRRVSAQGCSTRCPRINRLPACLSSGVQHRTITHALLRHDWRKWLLVLSEAPHMDAPISAVLISRLVLEVVFHG